MLNRPANQPLQRIPTIPHSPASPLHFLRLRRGWGGGRNFGGKNFLSEGVKEGILAGDNHSEFEPDPKWCSFFFYCILHSLTSQGGLG